MGNPFRVGDTVDGTVIVDAAAAVGLFDLHTGTFGLHEYDRATLAELRTELAGRDLACWCPLTDADEHAGALPRRRAPGPGEHPRAPAVTGTAHCPHVHPTVPHRGPLHAMRAVSRAEPGPIR